MTKKEKIAVAIVGFFVGALLVLLAMIAVGQSKCLSYGYPNADMALDGRIYCERKVNMSDDVVALNQLKNK